MSAGALGWRALAVVLAGVALGGCGADGAGAGGASSPGGAAEADAAVKGGGADAAAGDGVQGGSDGSGGSDGVAAGDAAVSDVFADGGSDAVAPGSRGTLLVVTTRAIAASSARLAPFLDAKRARGFDAVLITEDQYGADDLQGAPRAAAIRAWLRAQPLAAPAYALLIGDAHPLYGDVPMFVVWPRYAYSPTSCLGTFALDCRSFESDMPYADLSGDWDLSGDGQLGQHGLDDGPGGLDFEAELLVGRIPVYFGETAPLDVILDHAMAYEAEPPAERPWRRRMLLPAAFFYFQGQPMQSFVMPENVDGAETPAWFLANVLPQHPDVAVTRMVEREGVVTSSVPAELPLTEAGVIAAWSEGYGMVWWFGHGLERGVYRTVWKADPNGDAEAQPDEIVSPYLITSEGAATITPGHPAFVVGVSCEIGSAETPANLSYALLASGAAIGVVGSTSITPMDTTDYADPGSALDTQGYGGTNMGVRFFAALLDGAVGSRAFYDTKVELGQSGDVESYAGRMMLTWFGDPTLAL